MTKKKIFLFSSIMSLVTTVTVTPLAINPILNSTTVINETHASTRAITSNETQAKASWKYNNDNEAKSLSWYGKVTPASVSTTQLKELVQLDLPTADIKIQPLEITDDHLANGYIDFYVVQTVHEFNNGVPNGSKEVYLTPQSSGSSGGSSGKNDSSSTPTEQSKWTTKNKFNQMFISSKYKFEWKSDEEISDFLKTTDLTFDTLAIKDVLLNMVKTGEEFKLPSADKITLEKSGVNSTSSSPGAFVNANDDLSKQYGAVKLKISFGSDISDDKWVGDKKPTDAEVTKVIRGIKSISENNRTDMYLDLKPSSEIVEFEIDDQSPLKQFLTKDETKLKDLFPSELANFGNGSSELLNLLTKGTYLKNNSSSDNNLAAKIQYFGKKPTDADFISTTGLSTDIALQSSINSVEAIGNDVDGSLSVLYNYSIYDVYTDKIVHKTETQTFPPGSFKVNPDSGKVLEFSWKNNDDLVEFGDFSKIESDLTANSNNQDYINALANQFIDASNDVFRKNRTLTINVTSKTRTTKNVKVTMLFDSWSGAMYTDESGNKIEGNKIEKTFTIPASSITLPGVTWKSDSELTELKKLPINNVIDSIQSGTISLSSFVNITGNINDYNVLFDTNPAIGSVKISIEKNGNYNTQIFTGFKVEDNPVVQYNWVSQEQIPPVFFTYNPNEITPEFVIENYLNKSPNFADFNLTKDNVKLESSNPNILDITVTINKYNQSVATSDRTFKTRLSGFINTKTENKNSLIVKKNLTVIMSIVFALVTTIILTSILVSILVKRVKYKKLLENQSKKENNDSDK